MGDVVDVNLTERYVISELIGHRYKTGYDSLIVAAGANQSYFGNDHFAEFAPGMKTIDDALEVRGRILGALELAERTSDPATSGDAQIPANRVASTERHRYRRAPESSFHRPARGRALVPRENADVAAWRSLCWCTDRNANSSKARAESLPGSGRHMSTCCPPSYGALSQFRYR